jgi:hypothetical protein
MKKALITLLALGLVSTLAVAQQRGNMPPERGGVRR